jgi:hypothetical protein
VRVHEFAVKLFDRQDGEGVNWRMIAETLFKAAFDVLDRLPEDQKRAVARRVHEGAYDRMAGNAAGGPGRSHIDTGRRFSSATWPRVSL